MLRVSLIGNVGGDPDIRYTSEGLKLVTIRVAVNQQTRGREHGEREEVTHWFRAQAWSKWSQEAIEQRVAKGTRVYVTGRLEIGSYQARSGESRASYEVRIDEIQVLSRASEDESEDARPARAARSSAESRESATGELEDLPF